MKLQIIKMEKNPIDDLFAKKLAEHRQEPSQRAFEKFQARLTEREQQKRGGGFLSISHNRRWYYAAAAGLAIALSVVFLGQKDGSETDFAQNDKPKEVIQPKKSIETQIVKEQLATSKPNIIEKQKVVQPIQENKVIEKLTESPVSIVQNEVKEEKINTISNPIIDDTIESVVINNTQTQTTDNQVVKSNLFKGVQPQNTDEKITESTVIATFQAATVDDDLDKMFGEETMTEFEKLRQSAMEREENSKSFLARLTEEYKHFKYGEKVDLKNLKVNPKEALARADERVLNEERNDLKEVFYRKFGKFLKN